MASENSKKDLEAERERLVDNISARGLALSRKKASLEHVLNTRFGQELPEGHEAEKVYLKFVEQYKEMGEEQLETKRKELLVSRSPLIYRKASIGKRQCFLAKPALSNRPRLVLFHL